MRANRFKAGDHTRAYSAYPGMVNNVVAKFEGNQITVSWSPITANVPSGTTVYYQLQYSNEPQTDTWVTPTYSNNNATVIMTGIKGTGSSVPYSSRVNSGQYFYTSDFITNSLTPPSDASNTAGYKYVLSMPVSGTQFIISIISAGAIGVQEGIGWSGGSSKSFNFRVRACFGSNDSQSSYPANGVSGADDGYGNWGYFSIPTVAASIKSVAYSPTMVLNAALTMANPVNTVRPDANFNLDYFNPVNTNNSYIHPLPNSENPLALQYLFTKSATVKVTDPPLLNSGVKCIRLETLTGSNITLVNTKEYYNIQSDGKFGFPSMIVNTVGVGTLHIKYYDDLSATGANPPENATMLETNIHIYYDNVSPSPVVSDISQYININTVGNKSQIVTSLSDRILLDLRTVLDVGDQSTDLPASYKGSPYLVGVNYGTDTVAGATSNSFRFYKWQNPALGEPTYPNFDAADSHTKDPGIVDITEDVGLSTGSKHFEIYVYDMSANKTSKIGDVAGIPAIDVEFGLVDPTIFVWRNDADVKYNDILTYNIPSNPSSFSIHNMVIASGNNVATYYKQFNKTVASTVKMWLNPNHSDVSHIYYRYKISTTPLTIADDGTIAGGVHWDNYPNDFIIYDEPNMKVDVSVNHPDLSKGKSLTLLTGSSGHYYVYVQTKLTGGTVNLLSKPILNDVYIDTSAPVLTVDDKVGGLSTQLNVPFHLTTTGDPDIWDTLPFQFKVSSGNDATLVVSPTVETVVSKGLDEWFLFPSDGVVTVQMNGARNGATQVAFFQVKDFAGNVSSIVSHSVAIELGGIPFNVTFLDKDGQTLPGASGTQSRYQKQTETVTDAHIIKVQFNFLSDASLVSKVKVSSSNMVGGSQEFDASSRPSSSTFTTGVITLTGDTGLKQFNFELYASSKYLPAQAGSVLLDLEQPTNISVSYKFKQGSVYVNAINGNVVTSNDIQIIITASDKNDLIAKITGDGISNKDTTYPDINKFTKNTSNPFGTNNTYQATISKLLTSGDGNKAITIYINDCVDSVLRESLGNVVIKNDTVVLDATGGQAPKNFAVRAITKAGVNTTPFSVNLTWNAPDPFFIGDQRYYITKYEVFKSIDHSSFPATPSYTYNWSDDNGSGITYNTIEDFNAAGTYTYTIKNIPQDEALGPVQYYEIRAVLQTLLTPSPFTPAKPAIFAQPITVTLDFAQVSNTVPTLIGTIATNSPVATLSVPRIINSDENATIEDLAIFLAKQMSSTATGWDLVNAIYVWDGSLENTTTKVKGNWITFYKDGVGVEDPKLRSIKEGEGYVVEFNNTVTGTHDFLFDGAPWSYDTFNMTLKQGLNLIGLPRNDFAGATDLGCCKPEITEVSLFDEFKKYWDSFIQAAPNHKPSSMLDYLPGEAYFVRVTSDIVISFVGEIYGAVQS